MADLHMSKVAVGCASIDVLQARQRSRARGGIVPVYTRFRPKRADELIGGSIFWIVRHRIVARQTILGFAEDEESRRTVIEVAEPLVPVLPQPRRAHQGWRYLASEDAPADLDDIPASAAVLPERLIAELSELALI
jgi:hypothetical protein